MTGYLKPKFSVGLGSTAYRKGWVAIFGKELTTNRNNEVTYAILQRCFDKPEYGTVIALTTEGWAPQLRDVIAFAEDHGPECRSIQVAATTQIGDEIAW